MKEPSKSADQGRLLLNLYDQATKHQFIDIVIVELQKLLPFIGDQLTYLRCKIMFLSTKICLERRNPSGLLNDLMKEAIRLVKMLKFDDKDIQQSVKDM